VLERDREGWGGLRGDGPMVRNSMAKAAVRKSQACFPLSMGGRLEGGTEGNSWTCEMCFSSMSFRGGRSWSFGLATFVGGVLSLGSVDIFPVASTQTRFKGRVRCGYQLTVLADVVMDLVIVRILS